jgi:hypothetical protein
MLRWLPHQKAVFQFVSILLVILKACDRLKIGSVSVVIAPLAVFTEMHVRFAPSHLSACPVAHVGKVAFANVLTDGSVSPVRYPAAWWSPQPNAVLQFAISVLVMW